MRAYVLFGLAWIPILRSLPIAHLHTVLYWLLFYKYTPMVMRIILLIAGVAVAFVLVVIITVIMTSTIFTMIIMLSYPKSHPKSQYVT